MSDDNEFLVRRKNNSNDNKIDDNDNVNDKYNGDKCATEKEKFPKNKLFDISNLSKNCQIFFLNYSKDLECFKKLRNQCIVNLTVLIIFCGLGAVTFRYTEGAVENFYKCGVKRIKRDFIDHLWKGSQYLREDDWKMLARTKLRLFEDQLHTAHEAGLHTYSGQRSWSFLNSFVYCLTIITTIGYFTITCYNNCIEDVLKIKLGDL